MPSPSAVMRITPSLYQNYWWKPLQNLVKVSSFRLNELGNVFSKSFSAIIMFSPLLRSIKFKFDGIEGLKMDS